LSERSTEIGEGEVLRDHPEQLLTRRPAGGFTLESTSEKTIVVLPQGADRRVEGPEAVRGCLLIRSVDPPGFVLRRSEDDSEVGRTQSAAEAASLVLLEDARVFRIMLRGAREPRFELTGWETPGAYLVARPEQDHWRISPRPACGGMSDITVLSVLFAAEIVESEASDARLNLEGL
jgi:hypothetical protein